MTEHAWIIENLETYSAGGLEPAERERFDEHLARCSDCAYALAEAQAVDRNLESLFAPIRPEAGLEDRMIRELRTLRRRPWYMRKFVLGAAAAVGICAV